MNYCTSTTQLMSSLTPNAIKIFLFLQQKANRATGSSFWRKSKIAEACNISLSSFARGLRELKKHNLVSVRERYDTCGRQKSNEYFVTALSKATSVQAEACALTGSTYKVYLYLTQKCGNKAMYAVRKREIATACNLSLSTVKNALNRLKTEKYISWLTCTREDNGKGYNRYRINNIKRRLHNMKVLFLFLLKNLTPSPGSSVTPHRTLSKLKLIVRKRIEKALSKKQGLSIHSDNKRYSFLNFTKGLLRLLR